MGRWEPDARERLRDAALELAVERGFEATTVADIAARAGLTERTFYRHFGDKREVLFGGQEPLARTLGDAIDGAEGSAWLPIVETALRRLDEFFSAERRDWSRRRQVAIDADPALREREQLKMADLADLVTERFAARGTPPASARLAGETASALLKTAFADWVSAQEQRSFAELVTAAADGLRRASQPTSPSR